MKINFDSSLYDVNAIKKAIVDYRGLAAFSSKEQKGDIVVKISKIRKELKPLFRQEFSNYILYLTGVLK